MKKVYEKPEILFESFSLSTNIAGDCDVITGEQSENSCAIQWGPNTIIYDTIVACGLDGGKAYPNPNGQNDTYCYHVPTDTTNIFNS